MGNGLQPGQGRCKGGDFFSCFFLDIDTLVGKAGKGTDVGAPQALGWPCYFNDT